MAATGWLGGNALTFGSDGTLYAAAFASGGIYRLHPTTAAATLIGTQLFPSAGDLAFHEGSLYYAGSGDVLVRLNLTNIANSTIIAPMGAPDVFGLISKNGVLYGVSKTNVYTINTTTGAATNPVSFAGKGLGNAGGQALR